MATLRTSQASQDVLPGISNFAFEELKKEKRALGIKMDDKIRHDSQLSMEQFIKEQEEWSKFLQQQINDKVKADKDAAEEDAASQKDQSTKAIQAQQARVIALIALLKELNELEKAIESNKKDLTKAHKKSQGTLKKIADKVIDAVSKLLSPKNQKKYQKAAAKQQQRMASAQYVMNKEQRVKEAQETLVGLTEDQVNLGNDQIAQQLTHQETVLQELVADTYLRKDNPNYKSSKFDLLVKRDAALNQVRLKAGHNMARLVMVEKFTESLTDEEVEQRANAIYRNESQQIQQIRDEFNEAVSYLNHSDFESTTKKLAEFFGNLDTSELSVNQRAVVNLIGQLHNSQVNYDKVQSSPTTQAIFSKAKENSSKSELDISSDLPKLGL